MPSDAPPIGEDRVDPDEATVIAEMLRLIVGALERQYPPGVTFRRDAHPKLHGIVRAEFTVLPNLPEWCRYGLFAAPRTYDAWIRFSAATGPIRSDAEPDAQGMAIKLLGVPGEKIEPEGGAETHDLVLVNYPTFNASDPKQFLAMLGPAKAAYVNAHPELESATRAVYAQPVASPLQIRYWSMTPYKLGPGAMKFSARRVDSPLDARPLQPGPSFLREVMVDELATRDVAFDFLIQRQLDSLTMPIENALVEWREAQSPFVRVATIRIPRQAFDSEQQRAFGDDLAFSPWNALPEHQPIGGINRARRSIYAAIAQLRHERNGTPA